MRNGISGAPVASKHEYAQIVTELGAAENVAPLLVYAIRLNETSEGDPPDIVSGDGGHGVMQLTSSYPPDWADPRANIAFAIENFIAPEWASWVRDTGLQGENLVRAIAASYNAGYGAALAAHNAGDVDAATTNQYGARALANYRRLLAETR